MSKELLQTAIGMIDDQLIADADHYEVKPMKKRTILKAAIGLAAAGLVAACAITVVPEFINHTQLNFAGGTHGKVNLNAEILITGAEYEIHDEEAVAFLEESKESLISSLQAMGETFHEFRICQKGYSHIQTGDAGNSMAVDWREYLVYDGDQILAIITVNKDADGLHEYLAWAGLAFESYSQFLAEHRGEELVYLYIGDVEAILTPDHQVYVFGHGLPDAVDENEKENYYSFFKLAQNTYIPE